MNLNKLQNIIYSNTPVREAYMLVMDQFNDLYDESAYVLAIETADVQDGSLGIKTNYNGYILSRGDDDIVGTFTLGPYANSSSVSLSGRIDKNFSIKGRSVLDVIEQFSKIV